MNIGSCIYYTFTDIFLPSGVTWSIRYGAGERVVGGKYGHYPRTQLEIDPLLTLNCECVVSPGVDSVFSGVEAPHISATSVGSNVSHATVRHYIRPRGSEHIGSRFKGYAAVVMILKVSAARCFSNRRWLGCPRCLVHFRYRSDPRFLSCPGLRLLLYFKQFRCCRTVGR